MLRVWYASCSHALKVDKVCTAMHRYVRTCYSYSPTCVFLISFLQEYIKARKSGHQFFDTQQKLLDAKHGDRNWVRIGERLKRHAGDDKHKKAVAWYGTTPQASGALQKKLLADSMAKLVGPLRQEMAWKFVQAYWGQQHGTQANSSALRGASRYTFLSDRETKSMLMIKHISALFTASTSV